MYKQPKSIVLALSLHFQTPVVSVQIKKYKYPTNWIWPFCNFPQQHMFTKNVQLFIKYLT